MTDIAREIGARLEFYKDGKRVRELLTEAATEIETLRAKLSLARQAVTAIRVGAKSYPVKYGQDPECQFADDLWRYLS